MRTENDSETLYSCVFKGHDVGSLLADGHDEHFLGEDVHPPRPVLDPTVDGRVEYAVVTVLEGLARITKQ